MNIIIIRCKEDDRTLPSTTTTIGNSRIIRKKNVFCESESIRKCDKKVVKR